MAMILTLLLTIPAFAADYGLRILENGHVTLYHLQCLPAAVKEKVKAKDAQVTVRKTFDLIDGKEELVSESREMNLFTNAEITKACGLDGLSVYFEGKLYPQAGPVHFNYVLSEKSMCGYSTPRLEASFSNNRFEQGFLLGPGFSVLGKKELAAAEKQFAAEKAKNPDKLPWGAMEYFSRANEKGAIFFLMNQTEMGTKISLFRMLKNKVEEVDSEHAEPCGS